MFIRMCFFSASLLSILVKRIPHWNSMELELYVRVKDCNTSAVIPVRRKHSGWNMVPGWMPHSQGLRDVYSFFKFNSWNILRVRPADGVTPGYWLPALKKCIDLLPQFRVTISKKGLLFWSTLLEIPSHIIIWDSRIRLCLSSVKQLAKHFCWYSFIIGLYVLLSPSESV